MNHPQSTAPKTSWCFCSTAQPECVLSTLLMARKKFQTVSHPKSTWIPRIDSIRSPIKNRVQSEMIPSEIMLLPSQLKDFDYNIHIEHTQDVKKDAVWGLSQVKYVVYKHIIWWLKSNLRSNLVVAQHFGEPPTWPTWSCLQSRISCIQYDLRINTHEINTSHG